MVAGDHPDPDPGRAGRRDGSLRRRSGRVHDANQPQQLEIRDRDEQVARRVEGGGVEVLARGRDHPEALLTESLVLGQIPVRGVTIDLDRAAVRVPDGGGPGQQLIGGALHEAPHDVPTRQVAHVVEGGHELVVGVERQLGDPRVGLPGRDGVDTTFRRQRNQGALGRVADELTVADDGVGGQHHRQQEVIHVHRLLAGDSGDGACGRVAGPVDRESTADQRHLHGGHLVQRQRPGLVGVDRRRRPERFGRLHPFHDRASLGQPLRTGRQDGGDHRGQILRKGPDRERHRPGEQHRELGTPGQVQRHRHHQGHAGDPQDLPGQLGQLAGEGRLRLVLGLQQARDLADLGPHPDRRDDELSRPAGDVGVHVNHVDAITQRCVGFGDRIGPLGDGKTLPRQGGLRGFEGCHPQQAPIGWDNVTGLDRHHIAGHELLRGNLLELSVTRHLGRDDHHLLQGGHGGRSLALLPQTQHGVEQGEQDQHDAGLQLPQRVETHDTAHHQHDLHRVRVLPHEGPPPRLDLARREPVAAIGARARRHLGSGQTPNAVHLQDPQNFFHRHGVPVALDPPRRCRRGYPRFRCHQFPLATLNRRCDGCTASFGAKSDPSIATTHLNVRAPVCGRYHRMSSAASSRFADLRSPLTGLTSWSAR